MTTRQSIIDKLQAEGRLPLALPKRRKYRNKPTPDAEGRVHPSKLQARVTNRLRDEGWIVIPEVSMPLSERKDDRIRLDAIAMRGTLSWLDPVAMEIRFIEIKGFDTPAGIQKRRRFEDRFGLKIEVIRK